jgi:TolB-like protein/class 3 adenylate cyclase/tetratricopeptide (TPR) repeat protein
MQRRLMTIVCADVAGYSRLIGVDEEGTIESLKAHRRALVDPKIASHAGRIVKTMGDGLLLAFGSPVEAMRCAIEIQQGMAARNESVPEERRILFRIGINLGDVVAERDDFLGDGVIIATRLQALAEVGGICVTRAVRDQVRDRLAVNFEFLGEQNVHNIARPIRCYAVRYANYTALSPRRLDKARGWLTPAIALVALVVFAGAGIWFAMARHPATSDGGPVAATPTPALAPTRLNSAAATPPLSIVVLPFQNTTGSSDQDYLADGLTDDVTADLSRISGSFVISRNSAFTFKGKAYDEREVAHALGIKYILEGTVRRTDDQIRINASLIDGDTGGQLWTDRFDHPIQDVAAFQDEVTGRIVNSLSLELVANEARKSRLARPNDPDAVDLTMRGWWLMRQPDDRQRTLDARKLFEQALEKDRQSVPALLGLAQTYALMVGLTWSQDPDGDLGRGEAAVAEALALSPQNAIAYYIKASLFFNRDEHPEAISACQTSIALDRNYAPAYGFLAALVRLEGHPERSITLLRQAIKLSPRDPDMWKWLQFMARAQSDLGQADEAIENFHRAIAVNPGAPAFQWALLSTAYARGKHPAEARNAMDTFLRLSPGLMEGKPDDVVRAMRIQMALALRGYYLGIIDGDIGKQTRRALASFQKDNGLPVSENPDDQTVSGLGLTIAKPDEAGSLHP